MQVIAVRFVTGPWVQCIPFKMLIWVGIRFAITIDHVGVSRPIRGADRESDDRILRGDTMIFYVPLPWLPASILEPAGATGKETVMNEKSTMPLRQDCQSPSPEQRKLVSINKYRLRIVLAATCAAGSLLAASAAAQ